MPVWSPFLYRGISIKYIYWGDAIWKLEFLLQWLSTCRNKMLSCENAVVTRPVNHVGAFNEWAILVLCYHWCFDTSGGSIHQNTKKNPTAHRAREFNQKRWSYKTNHEVISRTLSNKERLQILNHKFFHWLKKRLKVRIWKLKDTSSPNISLHFQPLI